jgi:hypothetical protein
MTDQKTRISAALSPAGAKGKWWRRLLSDERGTATTETVIMIPMYAIVWGCIVYVTQFFQETHEMRARLRRDTWAYGYTGCTDAPSTLTNIPEPTRGIIPDTTGGAFEGSASGGGSTGESGGIGGLFNAVDNIISYIPGLNFQTITPNRTTSLDRPNVIGGGRMNMAADLTLLCNEEPQGVISFVIDAVRSAFGF